VAHFAAALVPADTLSPVRPVVGRFLAAPVRRGEPLTDERLLSPALLAADGSADALAVPVRVTDAAATAALVQAGNRVDVLSAGDPSTGSIGPTGQVVQNVEVLAMTRAASDDGAGVVIVAVTATQAAALAALPNGDQVSLALRRRVVQTAAPNG
jgi:Flp pilus assembly protein CpaB